MREPEPIPARVRRVAEARERYGDLVERMSTFLERGDPTADEAIASLAGFEPAARAAFIDAALEDEPADAPAPLQALVSDARAVPPWVDWDRIERAGVVFRRAGVFGGLTLGLRSLVHGYAAPAGNKPLAFSGRLTARADRRLAETGRFVTAVAAPGGMRPGGDGWRITLKVRLMHAQVRRLVLDTGRWDRVQWSLPINQHDMLATIFLFSNVFVEGLRLFGLHVTDEEADDYQHLWRWVARVIGVVPELEVSTYAEARRLAEYVNLTQGEPDADSRALVSALLEGPLRRARTDEERRRAEGQVALARGLCRSLAGEEVADGLGLPRDRYRFVLAGVRASVRTMESVRRRVPQLEALAEGLGARYWAGNLERGLGDVPAAFDLPDALADSPPARSS